MLTSQLTSWTRKLGFALSAPNLTYRVLSKLFAQSVELPFQPRGMKHPMWLRTKSSDLPTYRQIFVKQEYQVEGLPTPRTILDCGANIGCSAIFYAGRYPDARIYAVESEHGNYELLCRNTQYYDNVTPIHAAIWRENVTLQVVDTGRGEWGYATGECTAENSGPAIPGRTIDRLMDEHGLDFVDILKVDIEGAEKDVFADASRWIDRVGVVIVELHDRFIPGCRESVEAAVVDFPERIVNGEHLFFARTPKKKAA